jgi:hypothetical protein
MEPGRISGGTSKIANRTPHNVALTQQDQQPFQWFEILRDEKGLPKYTPFTQERFAEIIGEVFGI